MNKFCSNCGCVLDENTRFCPNCGAAVIETPAPVIVEETPVEPVENTGFMETVVLSEVSVTPPAPPVSEPTPQPRKTPYHYSANAKAPKPVKKKSKIIPALISVLLIAVIGFATFFILDNFGLLGNFTYKGAVKNYFSCMNYGDASKLEDLAPEAYWDYLEDAYNRDFDDYQESWEENWNDNREYLEEEYGEDYEIKYEIKSKSEVSKTKLKKIAKSLKDSYDIKASEVTKGYRLKLEITIAGSEDDDDENSTIYVLKIDGKWYLANVSEYGDSYSVSFLVN